MPPNPPGEFELSRQIDGKPQTQLADREVANLAQRQYGVVSRAQLLRSGLGEDAIDARVSRGRLYTLHRGAYAVGHMVVSKEGRWLAAVMRVGDDAVLSHRSAAALWGIKQEVESAPVHVSAARPTGAPPGIRRRYLRLTPAERALRRRIPVTTLVRTLFDLASEASPDELEAVIREAEYRHRLRIERLEEFVATHAGHRGTGTIKACLLRLGRGPRGRTRFKLEERFAALLAESDLPKPKLNALLDLGHRKVEADCLWTEQRLVVELDGGQAHRTRVAFEVDRERDRHLQVAGWRVIRITWRQLDQAESLLADLRRLLFG